MGVYEREKLLGSKELSPSSPIPQHWGFSHTSTHTAFSVDAGDLHFGPHTCAVNFTTEPPLPQPL